VPAAGDEMDVFTGRRQTGAEIPANAAASEKYNLHGSSDLS
jgi:hypothetical protein